VACDLNPGEDQRQILNAAAAMLDASYPLARLRGAAQDDVAVIAAFGAFALTLPEESGGAGFGLVEEALLHVLLGRHLVSTKVLATAMAARLARELGRADIAAQAASGAIPICAAVASTEDRILLIDAEGAALALVFGEQSLALIDVGGRNGEPITGLGHGVALTGLSRQATVSIGQSAQALLRRTADLLVSAQLAGIAQASRDLAVAYAKVRQQFGRPIGSFQAVKHHCANMALAAEMLSAQLDMAVIAERNGREDAPFQAAALVQLAARIALANARTCIQIHGGIGFSAEADAHHYLKQAHVLRLLASRAALLDLPAPLAPHIPLNERL
jgi:alkylation response protein AidB-like acyl-CoA dehydrogenase